MEDGRKLDTGNVLAHPEGQMEVTGVKYQETEDGVKHSFEYTLRHKDELDAERAADDAKAAKLAEAQALAVEDDATPTLG